MKKTLLSIMSLLTLLSVFGCSDKRATASSQYPQDKITAKDGTEIPLPFYSHASIAVEALGQQIYVDPVGKDINWEGEPKADLILVTHEPDVAAYAKRILFFKDGVIQNDKINTNRR